MNKYFQHLKSDIPSGIVVFLVALPLCLGIALASNAPLFSGLVAGIVGGLVVGLISGSQLSVSGPAAGLTVIVINAIDTLSTFEAFLVAVMIGGVIQLVMGILKAGVIGHFFPSAVIKGMLAAIGLILILKQIPHALGDDRDYEGDSSFFQPDGENTFTEIILAIQNVDIGAFLICGVCLAILFTWERGFMKKLKWTTLVPGPLVAVLAGIAINEYYRLTSTKLYLSGNHLVKLPVSDSFDQVVSNLSRPDFSVLADPQVYVVGLTIAIVASLETLLSLDAVDKLDPHKRIAPQSRELKAQGIGNIVSGFLGGLPVTSVIVRSSANVSSGAQTKVSAVFHGLLLTASVLLFPTLLNLIPLAALAAVLLIVGYKLTKPAIYENMFEKGLDQFLPFIVTVLAILFTDLLTGIGIGMVVGLFFVIKSNLHKAIHVHVQDQRYTITLLKDVSFLNKAQLRRTLEKIPEGAHVIFDESKAIFIDKDIAETINDFKTSASSNNISTELKSAEVQEATKAI